MNSINRAALLSCFLWLAMCSKNSQDSVERPQIALHSKHGSSNSPQKAGKKTIAVIPKGTTHEFWKAVHAGASKAGRELGIEIVWKGPVREDDRDEQVKVVENFIASGVDGIVLAPLDDTALIRPVKDAAREGIPVVIMDSDLKWDGRVSFIATDNYRGGAEAARQLGKILGSKGNVLVLRYQEGSASTTNREKGFLDTLKKEFPDIRVVSSNQFGGATTETAVATSENLLIKFRNIQGIFCPNESTTFGMLRALQDASKAGKIHFVGFDSSKKLVEALRKGEIEALILQNPFLMGELGVRTLAAKLNGEKVEKRIDTGVEVVTQKNMDEPKIHDLLFPNLRSYRFESQDSGFHLVRGLTDRVSDFGLFSQTSAKINRTDWTGQPTRGDLFCLQAHMMYASLIPMERHHSTAENPVTPPYVPVNSLYWNDIGIEPSIQSGMQSYRIQP